MAPWPRKYWSPPADAEMTVDDGPSWRAITWITGGDRDRGLVSTTSLDIRPDDDGVPRWHVEIDEAAVGNREPPEMVSLYDVLVVVGRPELWPVLIAWTLEALADGVGGAPGSASRQWLEHRRQHPEADAQLTDLLLLLVPEAGDEAET